MRIVEIQQLKPHSPALRLILACDVRYTVYRFLREQVQARVDCYPQGAHFCEHCGRFVSLTLVSPYNAPHPGWCIDCVLGAFFTPDMPLYGVSEEISHTRISGPYFVNEGNGWFDQDGNPVAELPFRFP